MGNMRLKNIILSFLVVFSVSGCGYDGHFRYPCQDPANWNNAECKPPICTTAGACPEDLVGSDIVNGTIEKDLSEEEINEQE